ncbi:biotin-dependent carboxyltransferase family protein [Sporosarcina psychrophila]|uniref:5-oxoprolinase subunit C family protein n=1 Tax=Sporosarcina psychrophila TaxID=1476 RepID=UPI00078E9D1D|nr:biotin-dependent carboxyltransferase family protein [Sporosarcina psychrophila]AMQ07840.1 allophanate hydrolase [Sporosarcina psychrophila]
MINVLKPGLHTTIQDFGRVGYYEIGMPPSGALDKYSYSVANLLVGNDPKAAVLEITYMGPELEFKENTLIAITGGEIPPKINRESVPMYETLKINAGDVLSFDFLKNGARVYLSVAGGIDVPEIMSSRSTYTLSKIGGINGRALKEGDTLFIGNLKNKSIKEGVKLPPELITEFSNTHELRIIEGLYNHRITQESRERFFEIEWTVTPDANRVGYRLKGERLNFVPRKQPYGAGSNPSNVVDVGYPIGSIQIPDGIEPIILLNDAVTSGGYATVGTVISADLDVLAQAKTHDKLKFISISMGEALQVRKEQNKRIEMIEEFIYKH